MLEALAVDLDTNSSVVVEDTAEVTVNLVVNLDVDLLDVEGLLPDDFDLVDVQELVHVDRVF